MQMTGALDIRPHGIAEAEEDIDQGLSDDSGSEEDMAGHSQAYRSGEALLLVLELIPMLAPQANLRTVCELVASLILEEPARSRVLQKLKD
eukprot:11477382-Prorocentrum_lima.AAC.1